MKKEALLQAKKAYIIESECIAKMLDYFDEDLQAYFADVLDLANQSISKYEQLFWRLTKLMLNGVVFDEETKTFVYNKTRYCLPSKNIGGCVDYNMNSLLGTAVMDAASKVAVRKGHIIFDYSNYPYKITNIEELKGRTGFLILSKLSIDSFENEEYLFFNGLLDDGTVIDEDTIIKLFRLETIESLDCQLTPDAEFSLEQDAIIHCNKVVLESEQRSNLILNEEIARINKWADDKIESTQLDVEMMRNERKNLQKQSDLAESAAEREAIETAILKLSKRIKMAWLALADAEDDIEAQRKSMIKKLREQMMRDSHMETIFMVSFSIK